MNLDEKPTEQQVLEENSIQPTTKLGDKRPTLPSYVAAFRTYTWDDDVAELARRFFRACPTGRKVILADETHGKLPIPNEYEVVSHTTDTSELGVPDEPKGSSLWYNVDYGVYFLRLTLPDYTYYVLSESDLAVNLDLEPMIAAAAEEKIDLLTHDIRPSDEKWIWHVGATTIFDNPLRSLLCFMVLSDRAIDRLLCERQRLGIEFLSGRLSFWPFCEPFVPTVIRDAGMNYAELSRFADTENLRYRPRICLDDHRANRPGSLVHSVLGRVKYVKAVLDEALRLRDTFFPNTELANSLRDATLADYADHLMMLFHREHDHSAIVELTIKMKEQGLAVDDLDACEDLAFCRPALASSTCEWSRYPDPHRDAAGANGPEINPDYGFHTELENSPWWMVDLGAPCSISEVRIVNRPGFPERFLSFVIESSDNSTSWQNRFTKLDLASLSADANAPAGILFDHPFVARYVRLRLVERGVIHLRRVQVMGRRLSPTPSSLSFS
jgi:hypothetical protein